jgi:DNA repair exonuclease SbcCD ATPase subunit
MIDELTMYTQHKEEIRKEANKLEGALENLTDLEKAKISWMVEGVMLTRPIYDGTMPTQ